jgi:transcriptional regulator with XRE-family HTH domain
MQSDMASAETARLLTQLGALIRSARETALGIRQAELGRRASVDKGTISRLERGQVYPERNTLTRVFDILDRPLRDLGRLEEFLDTAARLQPGFAPSLPLASDGLPSTLVGTESWRLLALP